MRMAARARRATTSASLAALWRGALWGLLALALGATLLALPTSVDPAAQGQTERARLERELRHARDDLGVPAEFLAPIIQREQAADVDPGDAPALYAGLYQRTLAVEATSLETLRQQTNNDLQQLTLTLQQRHNEGAPLADTYQQALDQAVAATGAARLPGDFAAIDGFVKAQIEALDALPPTYQQLQQFEAALIALRDAGAPSALGEAAYAGDQARFQQAATASDYRALRRALDGQQSQLLADESAAMPQGGAGLLALFQRQIERLRQEGEDTATFQRQHDQDTRDLASARQAADYLALAQRFQRQTAALSLPLARGQARQDLASLAQLIASAQRRVTVDPYNGVAYPDAYEYADDQRGIGSVRRQFDAAVTVRDFQQVDDVVAVLTTNLRAMLANLDDPTPHDQPHKTDLDLLDHYGALHGKAMILSLREQTARFYEDGKLVNWTLVVTGRPERPSPPGLHEAMRKYAPVKLTSPDPPNSPYWFAPTPIQYGIEYADGGFFIHDAWWRTQFGLPFNLPHYDPIAFNGGSHGCINVPKEKMQAIYDWMPLNTPVIVY